MEVEDRVLPLEQVDRIAAVKAASPLI